MRVRFRSFLVVALIVCALLSPGSRARADAPTGAHRVTVVDAKTKAPVAVARAEIYGARSLRAYSGADGRVAIDALPPGTYEVVVTNSRYLPQTLKAVVVAAGAPTAITVALQPRPPSTALRQIGTTKAQTGAKANPDEIDGDSITARLGGTSVSDGLSSLANVSVAPNGDVSLSGRPSNQTQVTIDGIPVSPLGASPNIASFGSDLFGTVGVDRSSTSATGASLGFGTRNPALDWIGSANGVLGSFGNAAWSFTEAGTPSRLGISYAHAVRDEGNPLDGLGFLDTSGRDYLHQDITHTQGDAVKFRYPFSLYDTFFATATAIRTDVPLVCNVDTGPVPCGYGPNNRLDTSLLSLQLRDTFIAGRASGYVTLFHNVNTSDDDRTNLLVAGLAAPSRNTTKTLVDGQLGELDFTVGANHDVALTILNDPQRVSSAGTAIGAFAAAPPLTLDHTTVTLDGDVFERRHLAGHLKAGFDALAGRTSPTVEARLSYKPTTSDAYALDASLGTQSFPAGVSAFVADPAALQANCAGGDLTGFGPSAASTARSGITRTSADWSHSGARISSDVTLTHEVDANASLQGYVSGAALDPTLFTPQYLAGAARVYAATCGGGPAPSIANLFYSVGGYATRATYDGGTASVTVNASRNVSASAKYGYVHATAVGSGVLFGPGSTIRAGAQLPTRPMHTGSLTFDAHLGGSATSVLAEIIAASANNPQYLPAYALANVGAEIRLAHGVRFDASLQNVTNTYGGTFATAANAVPLTTSFGRFPTVGAPIPPRSINVSFRVPFGPGAQLDDTPQIDVPKGSIATDETSQFGDKPPSDPFAINRRSGFCGPEDVHTAEHYLAIVRAAAQAIEAQKKATGRYPESAADVLKDGMHIVYRKNGERYALLVGPDPRLPYSDVVPIFKPFQGCATVFSPTFNGSQLAEILRRGLYLPSYDESHDLKPYDVYEPSVGFYTPISRLENDEINVRAFARAPKEAPADPFAFKNASSCGSDVRPAAEAFVNAVRPYIAAVYAKAPLPALPDGITATVHTAKGGTWIGFRFFEIRSDALASCISLAQVPAAMLDAANLDGETQPAIDYAPRFGFYFRAIEMTPPPVKR